MKNGFDARFVANPGGGPLGTKIDLGSLGFSG
jgi:hypothetical protein